MSDPKNGWFSRWGKASIDAIERRMAIPGDDTSDQIKLAVELALSAPSDEKTSHVSTYLKPCCLRCLSENPKDGDPAIWAFLALAGAALECENNGQWKEVATLMFACGEVWGELCSRFEWQTETARGYKVGAALQEAAEQTNQLHQPLRDKRFARLAELLPTMNLESAAACCESEGLGNASAIVRQWNRHKKKQDT